MSGLNLSTRSEQKKHKFIALKSRKFSSLYCFPGVPVIQSLSFG